MSVIPASGGFNVLIYGISGSMNIEKPDENHVLRLHKHTPTFYSLMVEKNTLLNRIMRFVCFWDWKEYNLDKINETITQLQFPTTGHALDADAINRTRYFLLHVADKIRNTAAKLKILKVCEELNKQAHGTENPKRFVAQQHLPKTIAGLLHQLAHAQQITGAKEKNKALEDALGNITSIQAALLDLPTEVLSEINKRIDALDGRASADISKKIAQIRNAFFQTSLVHDIPTARQKLKKVDQSKIKH